MINQRIEKVQLSIEKTQEKIAELTVKLKELEKQKTELENRQIIAIIRGERISDTELAALMKTLRGTGGNQNAADDSEARVSSFLSRKQNEEDSRYDDAYFNEN